MKKWIFKLLNGLAMIFCLFGSLHAQNMAENDFLLSIKKQNIIPIAAYAAKGELQQLKTALNEGLDAGLTVNEIKEVIVHLYAYCGFPRSIRALQICMDVLDERKEKGIMDETGKESSFVDDRTSKYERGKENLEKLTGITQSELQTGYAAFAPIIEIFLKEHLFADIFDRDVLTFAERELVTISVISSIGGAEPMLRSHFNICLHLGFTSGQLNQFIEIIRIRVGEKEANSAQVVLKDVLGVRVNESCFLEGQLLNSPNFTGQVWLNMMGAKDSTLHTSYGNVTFAPGGRTNWHSHPGGQILFITHGKGYYQAQGQHAILLQKGDYMEIPPNVVHWHGAAPDSEFAHIAISLNTDLGGAQWLLPVTDDEYLFKE